MYDENVTDIKVGDTTFNTHFLVTVPDYGSPIPECNTTGPIISPANLALWKILNMIERGLHVQFESKTAPEKIYFFLLEYNKFAQKINNREGEVLNPLATKSLEYFELKMNYRASMEKKASNQEFNPFVKQYTPNSGSKTITPYDNKAISGKFKKKKNRPIDNRGPYEHKLFEMFSQPNAVTADGKIVHDPNAMLGPSMPEYFEDMDLGD